MKKYITLTLVILCMFSLAGCGKRPLTEQKLMQQISDEMRTVEINSWVSSDLYCLDVEKLVIGERDTDKFYDTVYCNVVMGNELYEYNVDCVLLCNYYEQDGWILNDYEILNSYISPRCGLPEETVATFMENYYTEYDLVDHSYDDNFYLDTYCFNVEEEHANCAYNGTVIAEFEFYNDGDYGWWSPELSEDSLVCEWKLDGNWHSDLASTYSRTPWSPEPTQSNIDFTIPSYTSKDIEVKGTVSQINPSANTINRSSDFTAQATLYHKEDDNGVDYLSFNFYNKLTSYVVHIYPDDAIIKEDNHGFDELVKQ